MENKFNCDAYDSGYCYVLTRPLTDEEDDMCDYCCCYRIIKLNEKNSGERGIKFKENNND